MTRQIRIGVILALAAWPLSLWTAQQPQDPGSLPWGLALAPAGFAMGFLRADPGRRETGRPRSLSLPALLLGAGGMILGMVVAALLGISLSRAPGTAGWLAPIVVSTVLGILGALLFGSRAEALAQGMPSLHQPALRSRSPNGLVLVDTSVIIDGRVLEIVDAGFLYGTLGIPRFILDELQRIADSPDPLRRNRGRRGLEILNQLQQESKVPVSILDVDNRDRMEVDARLVQAARDLGAAILTADFNLDRVAELQGVRVLNINKLAHAMRPTVLPGEEMTVRVVQEGREPGQGVGFLDDGTMVVVDGGKRYINSSLDVIVTRILPTTAGRLIFAQPKGA